MVPHQVLSYEDPREECVNEVPHGGGMHATMVSHQVLNYEDFYSSGELYNTMLSHQVMSAPIMDTKQLLMQDLVEIPDSLSGTQTIMCLHFH